MAGPPPAPRARGGSSRSCPRSTGSQARSARGAASTSPRAAASWRPRPSRRSLVARRAPQVVEHPDLLPDTVPALLGDLSVVLPRPVRIEEPELGVHPVELALGVVQVGQRL